MLISVTEALYQALGKPELAKPLVFEEDRLCGNCRQRTAAAPASKALTSRFGSWEDIAVDPGGDRWLCRPCIWAYTSTDLRRKPSTITTDSVGGTTSHHQVRTLLRGPLPTNTAVIMPIGGKRIVAPRARWGQVVTDAGCITWASRHAKALAAMLELRAFGFGEKSLAEPSPLFHVLASVDVSHHQRIYDLWAQLRPVREDKTLCAAFLKMSRDDRD